MSERLTWSKFVHPMPKQRERMIEVTDVTPAGQVFFDPSSHYLFKEVKNTRGSEWTVAELPCNKGKPRP